jgi:hypothetical protein
VGGRPARKLTRRVGAEELAPGRSVAAGRRWNAPPAQEQANGGRGDAQAEVEELALDAAIRRPAVSVLFPEG